MSAVNFRIAMSMKEFETIEASRRFLSQYAGSFIEMQYCDERIEKLCRQRDEADGKMQACLSELRKDPHGLDVQEYQAAYDEYMRGVNELIALLRSSRDRHKRRVISVLSSIKDLAAGQQSDDMQKILIMKYIDGMEWREIAQELTLSVRMCQYKEQRAALLLAYPGKA